MLSVVIAAAAVVLAPAPSPARTAPAPVLRKIVYRFAFDRKVERSMTQSGGPSIDVGSASSNSGTLTVDVRQVGGDGSLRVSAKVEYVKAASTQRPFTAEIVVRPDGSLRVVNGTYDDKMQILLPYLATKYFVDHQLQGGATWKVVSPPSDSVKTTTTFIVTNVAGTSATISFSGQAHGGPLPGAATIQSTLVYKASLLVPLSLDVMIVRTGAGASAGTTAPQQDRTHYRFDRVSDSRDP